MGKPEQTHQETIKTRRQAIKSFALTCAGLSILPSTLRGADAPSKRVNIALIGTGRQGIQVNMATFLGMANVRVIAVCDVDRLRLAYAKSLVDQAYDNKDCRRSLVSRVAKVSRAGSRPGRPIGSFGLLFR